MDISASLIAKGTAGALAASAAVGGGIAAKGAGWLDGLFPGSEVSEVVAEIREDAQSSLDVQGSGDSRREPQDPGTDNVPGGEPAGSEDTGGGNLSGGGGQDGNLQGDPKASTPNSEGVGLPSGTGSGNNLGGSLEAPESSQQTNNQVAKAQGSTSDAKKQEKKLTKWDEALIGYLNETEKDDRDIIFTVTTGKENTKKNLTTTFPDFENDTQKRKLMITATVSTSSTDLMKGMDSGDGIKKLKKLNGGGEDGKDWTWECTITISKENKADAINLENKERLIGDNGYFNKLAKEGEKELKIKFIENCAKSRNSVKVREYDGKDSLEDGKISVEKTFEFQKDSAGTSWEMKNKKDFEDWFLTTANQAK